MSNNQQVRYRKWHFVLIQRGRFDIPHSSIKEKLANYPCYCCLADHVHAGSGETHIHGFIWFHKPVRRETMKTLLNFLTLQLRMLQPVQGDYKAERDYIAKQGMLYEFGKRPKT